MNRKAFYDLIRPRVNLTTQNVIGFEKVLDFGEAGGLPRFRPPRYPTCETAIAGCLSPSYGCDDRPSRALASPTILPDPLTISTIPERE